MKLDKVSKGKAKSFATGGRTKMFGAGTRTKTKYLRSRSVLAGPGSTQRSQP